MNFLGSNPELNIAAKQLIPAMNAIQGVEVINKPGVGWSVPNEVTPGKKLSEIDTLQEYGFGGGVASNFGAQRYYQRPQDGNASTPTANDIR